MAQRKKVRKDRNKPRGSKALEKQIKTRFKKGNKAAKGVQTGSTSPEQKEVVTLSRAMVTRYISQFAGFSPSQLTKMQNNPDTPMLERIIIAIIIKAEKNADQSRLEFILNRAIGKVQDEIAFTNLDPYAHLTDEQLLARRQELAQRNLETLRLMNRPIQVNPDAYKQPETTPKDVEPKPEGTTSGD